VTVYVEEAHPLEKHHFAGNIPLLTHQTIQVSTGLNEYDFSIFAKIVYSVVQKRIFENWKAPTFGSTLSQTISVHVCCHF
jgi:hypothetical protein